MIFHLGFWAGERQGLAPKKVTKYSDFDVFLTKRKPEWKLIHYDRLEYYWCESETVPSGSESDIVADFWELLLL